MRMRYNRGIMPTDIELQRQRVRANEKDNHAVIARDFSAGRMNATKWREAIDDLGEMGLRYRLRWVDVLSTSVWMGLWIPFSNSTHFDSAEVGPFKTFSIEWLEIDPVVETPRGKLLEPERVNNGPEIERRLKEVNVPYDWVEGYIRITGYVRNG